MAGGIAGVRVAVDNDAITSRDVVLRVEVGETMDLTLIRRCRRFQRLMMAATAAFFLFASTGADAASPEANKRLLDAVHSNDMVAVQASIGEGADPDARNRWGLSSIDVAIQKGYFDIAHFLSSARNVQRSAYGSDKSAREAAPADTTPAQVAPSRSRAAATVKESAHVVATKWPSSRPNPFDPGTPAAGAALPIVGESGPVAGGVNPTAWDQVLNDGSSPH
jgi:hypothetical protein